MKKFYGILILLAVMAFKTDLYAQTDCVGLTIEVIPVSPQTGTYNYFGVKVTLDQTYEQNITVEGSVGGTSYFYITVLSGNLTAQTTYNYHQSLPSAGAAYITIVSVIPTEVTKSTITYSTACAITNTAPGPTFEYNYITQDEDFLDYVASSSLITNVDSSNAEFIQADLDAALANINDSSTDTQIASAFNAEGFNGTQIATQLREQLVALNNLATNNSGLSNMTWQQRQEAVSNALTEFFKNQKLWTHTYRLDECAQEYKDGMDDCKTNYYWSIAATGLGTAAATIFGTPAAGALAWGGGVSISYGVLLSCKQGVVRDWKQCRGYN